MYFTADTPLPHENDIINDNYRLDYILLVTPTSILFLSTDLCDGSKKVLKFIKRFVGKEYRIENEVSITSCCNHPNIIKIYDDFEYKQFHVIVIDYTPYRCLYCIIHSHFPNGLPESTAREMFHQLLDGLNYTHSLSVIHRDIKTGNFLVFNPDLNNPLVRLTDFGYAQRLAYGELGNEYIGTPEYAAPEIFTKTKYSSAIDMWSMGVCLYEMLSGHTPWPTTSVKERNIAILLGKYNFNEPVWQNVSNDAKDLIKKLICVNPRMRLTASQALKHPWFDVGCKATPIESELAKVLDLPNDIIGVTEEDYRMPMV